MCNAVGIIFCLNPVRTFTFYIPNININIVQINKIVILPRDIVVCTVVSSTILNYIYLHFNFF